MGHQRLVCWRAHSGLDDRRCFRQPGPMLRTMRVQYPGAIYHVMGPLSMQKLVVVLGTNASGKSELGIRLANHLGGEVVSADSRQVYRGMYLGNVKITPAQAGTVRHHL